MSRLHWGTLISINTLSKAKELLLNNGINRMVFGGLKRSIWLEHASSGSLNGTFGVRTSYSTLASVWSHPKPHNYGDSLGFCKNRSAVHRTRRYFSFNVFDLLPDLERLKTKRSKRLKEAVAKGKVDPNFVSGFEYLAKPLGGKSPIKEKDSKKKDGSPNNGKKRDFRPFISSETRSRLVQIQQGSDLTLRCTELDINGNVTVRAGEFQKSELCAQHGLQPRDLRKIDSKFVNQMPAILVRRHAILVNLLHIRALIESDKMVLFDSIGSSDSYSQGILIYELQERLRSSMNPTSEGKNALPFEFRALEAVLISVVNSLQSDEEVLVNLIQNLLAYLEESVDRSKLRELLQYSKKLSRFEQKALNLRDAIEEVLEQDEDLAAMYLTQKLEGKPRAINDHEEVELMMETYLKQVEEIVNHVESVSTHVRTTEDVVNIILDSQRNSLLLLEIRLTIMTVGLSAGTFLSGLFGMNLLNSIEEHPNAFIFVSAVAFSSIVLLSVIGIRAMHRVLRKIN